MPGRLFFLLVVFSFPIFVSAQVYKWTDENGVVHYGDQEPDASHEQFEFQGYTEMESRKNTQIRDEVQRYNRDAEEEPEQESYAERRRRQSQERNERELARRCEGYVERIEYIDSRLRAGGYSTSMGNRLRAERRDLFSRRSRECLRGL